MTFKNILKRKKNIIESTNVWDTNALDNDLLFRHLQSRYCCTNSIKSHFLYLFTFKRENQESRNMDMIDSSAILEKKGKMQQEQAS